MKIKILCILLFSFCRLSAAEISLANATWSLTFGTEYTGGDPYTFSGSGEAYTLEGQTSSFYFRKISGSTVNGYYIDPNGTKVSFGLQTGGPHVFGGINGTWSFFASENVGGHVEESQVFTLTWSNNGWIAGGASQSLPQRKLSWTVTNSNLPPATDANSQTWAVFQLNGTAPTGIAFANRTLAAGESATLSIYVAQGDAYNYAPGRVDFKLSQDTYGGWPLLGTAYGLNPDGTTNNHDKKYNYMEGALPVAGSTGTVGNYGNATQVTEIPTGTTGPGVDNTTPVLNIPTHSTGGTVTVTPGSGGTTTSTDSGTASAIQQGSNAIIQAVNNTGQTTRQAIDRTTSAVNSVNDSIIQTKDAIEAGNLADLAERQSEQNARQNIEQAVTEGAAGSDVAQRDARLGVKDEQATSLFANVGGGMTASKVTPMVSSGDPSAWEFDLGVLGVLDINPFTNAWVQEKLPFLNWLVAFFRLALVWSAQITFYRWLTVTIRENAIAFMHTPSPPPTVIEGVASSNPFTALLGKLGAVFSSLFLAVLILSSLSTILSVVTTWGTVSSLVNSISEGTNALSSATTGLGATTGHLGRIVYLVTSYIPVTALLGIGANYIIIETGLVATMPVLVFSMRIRRW